MKTIQPVTELAEDHPEVERLIGAFLIAVAAFMLWQLSR